MSPLLSYINRPFARLLLPLALGIYLQERLLSLPICILLLLLSFTLIASSFKQFAPAKSYQFRYFFGLGSFIFFLVLGHLSAIWILPYEFEAENEKEETYLLQLDSDLIEKSKTLQANATLLRSHQSDHTHPLKIQLYFRKDTTSSTLRKGDQLLAHTHIRKITNAGNPYEFDYAANRVRKGFRYSAHISQWQYVGHLNQLSWKDHALETRAYLVSKISELKLTPNTYAFVSAITLGDKERLPDEIRNDFSIAGVAHILAVSGLHTGILFLIIMTLLWPLRYFRYYKWIYLVALALLWIYAFITGVPASVVRAAIMISILLFGKMINYKSDSLNTLCATGFIMLLSNPNYLYEIGFQLSFTALFSILLFYPIIQQIISIKHPMARKAIELISVTLAVQCLTLPLSIHYFGVLSIWFLPANLIILPLIMPFTLLCMIGIGWQLMGEAPDWIRSLIERFASMLLQFIRWITELPGNNYGSEIYLGIGGTILLGIALCSLLLFIHKRGAVSLILLLLSLIGLQGFSLLQSHKEIEEILLLNHSGIEAMHLIKNREHTIYSPDSLVDQEIIKRLTSEFKRRYKLQPPIYLHTDTLFGTSVAIHAPFISMNGVRFLHLSNNDYRYSSANELAQVDYILLSNTFAGGTSELQRIANYHTLILSTSLSSYVREKIKAECDSLSIPVYDIRQKGAFRHQFKSRYSNAD